MPPSKTPSSPHIAPQIDHQNTTLWHRFFQKTLEKPGLPIPTFLLASLELRACQIARDPKVDGPSVKSISVILTILVLVNLAT
jgi:hypothetical protein